MTRTQRRIIFYFFFFIFITITPAIILYATGYTYDWQKNKILHTGAIYLESYPTGAKIYINDKYIGKTKYSVKRLSPKEYNVRVEKDNFHSWQKKLEVKEAGFVTEARNILLVPKNPKLFEIANNISDAENYLLEEKEKEKNQKTQTTVDNLLKKDAVSWVRFNDYIYYLTVPSLTLYKADLDGSNKLQISVEPLPIPEISPDELINYLIIVGEDQKIAILDSKKNLYLYIPEERKFKLLTQDISGASFAGDNKKLAYWTEHEIWVIYLEKIQIQPYKKAGDKNFITRYAQKISQVIWYPEDNEHLIFVVGDDIKITELDDRDIRNTVDFINIKEPKIYYKQNNQLFDTSWLYILSENKLYRTQIKQE